MEHWPDGCGIITQEMIERVTAEIDRSYHEKRKDAFEGPYGYMYDEYAEKHGKEKAYRLKEFLKKRDSKKYLEEIYGRESGKCD